MHDLEHQLQRVEDRYRRTIEKAPIGIASTDAEGIIVAANDEYCALTRRPREALIGHHFTELLFREDVEAARKHYLAFVAAGPSSERYERHFVRGDGTPAWVNVTLSKMEEEDEEHARVIVLTEDITDRRRAAEELRLRKEQLDETQQIAHMGSWDYDFATGRRTWSDQMPRLYGLPPGTPFDLETFFRRIHPADVQRMREMMVRAHATRQQLHDHFRVIHDDGSMHTLQMRVRFVVDDRGTVTRGIGVVQDISERAAGEEELRRRAVQQAAVANLGQMALTRTSLVSLQWQAVAFVRDVLDADFSHLLQYRGDHFTLVEGSGWDEASVGVATVPLDGTPAGHAFAASSTVVVDDLENDERFPSKDFLTGAGAKTGVITPIASGGDVEPWGVLAAYSRTRRMFDNNDINFIRSIATVLAQAIERHRADAELRARAAQQSAIAELGRSALSSLTEATFERACELVSSGLGVEYAVFCDVAENGTVIRHRAGRGNARFPREIVVDAETQSGLTVLKREPIIVDDYRRETRFRTAREAAAAGMRSGVTVPIVSGSRLHGILGAHSTTAHIFTAADVHFIESLANILAEAMERERARRALVDSEERYRSVIEGASEIIFSVEPDGRIASLNPAFESITGWKCADWVGRNFIELVDEADRQRLGNLLARMQGLGVNVAMECAVIGRDRTVLLGVNAFSRMRDGKLIGAYGFARDVTEERRIESERQRLTRSLQLLLDSTVEGIYTMDNDGRCTMINAAAARMLGVDADEILGTNMDAVVHTRPIDRNVATAAEDVFRRRDGTSIPVDYSSAPIYDNGVAVGAVVAFTDVTERRKLELKLEQANRLSSLGRLAATVAHEFNNVLMGIAPFLDVIRRRPSATVDAVEHIARSVTRGKRITQDILRFTQPAEPVLTAVDVDSWLDRVAAEARSVAGLMHGVTVELAQRQLQIAGDAGQLHQILINLVLNARDAMPDGGMITIRAQRQLPGARFDFGRVEHPERFVHFMVSDTGCGMSPETLRHAFEPLFTTKKSGTGLGLAVTHQVVLHHGGEIFIESVVGVGTTFHIFIPLAETSGDETSATPRSAHVLIVEDDETVAAGLACLLELDGMTADVVESGAAAIEYVRHTKPSLVLLDLGLPDMHGNTVYERLTALHPDVPVIFSTGDAERASAASEGRLLLKPYDAESLRDVVRRALV